MKALQSISLAWFITVSVVAGADAELLDQQHDFAPDAEGTIRSDIDRAQTFTVGLTGTLTRIELRVRRFDALTSSPLMVDIRSTSTGVPVEADSPVLASASIPAASIPLGSLFNAPFSSVDLSAANLAVSTGNVLAIVLRSTDQYEWMKDNSGSYLAGSEFIRFPPSTWNVGSLDDDFAFRTFVVPESGPASVLLALGGFGVMWLRPRMKV